MNAEYRPILTNVRVYRSIADDAYRQMSADMNANIRPRPDGSDGVFKTFDPEQLSFKQAMISIVFTGIWLEAALHLLIVRNRGRNAYTDKVDHYSYRGKLILLDCADEELLRKVDRLQQARRDLVHEKAHREYNDAGEFTGELRTAQDEAENARDVMLAVEQWFDLPDGHDRSGSGSGLSRSQRPEERAARRRPEQKCPPSTRR